MTERHFEQIHPDTYNMILESEGLMRAANQLLEVQGTPAMAGACMAAQVAHEKLVAALDYLDPGPNRQKAA